MVDANRNGSGTVVMGDVVRGKSGTVVRDPHSLAATVSAVSLDATLAQPEPATGPAVPQDVATMTSPASLTLSRSTVLPRLRDGAVAPELVHADRPRYEKKGLLGEGGVGEVVKTIDNDIERTVAIKRLKSDMRAPGHVVRFVDEIRTIGSMEHPNIVPIHDVGVDEEGQYFFVMKFVEGETLESIIEKLAAGDPVAHARYGFERRVEIFQGVLDAVAYAHARGVVHRDIKPANVMVGTWGEVTVMDWGLARKVNDPERDFDAASATSDPGAGGGATPKQEPAAGSRAMFRTRAGTLLGTPAYMSPEQARGEKVDERSDVYSLSVMLHEMLCLQHYMHDATTLEEMLHGVQHRKLAAPSFVSSPHQSSAPMELSHFVRKGVAKNANERFQTVQQMIDRLRLRDAGVVPVQCPITGMKRVTSGWTHFMDRHPLVVMAMMTLCVLGALGSGGWGILRALQVL